MSNPASRAARLRLVSFVALIAAMPVASLAGSAPANDNWAAREIIPALPYPTDFTGGLADATTQASDPPFFCRLGPITTTVAPAAKTIWYGYTTGKETEYVNIATSGYNTLLAVYSGNPTDGFVQLAGGCNDDGAASGASRLSGLRLAAATSYSIVVAAFDAATPASLLQFDMASARVYAVSKTDDTRDGTCDADCSLREAIDAANADPGAVVVPGGSFTLSRLGAGEDGNSTGDLDVRGGYGIHGADSGATTIDGNNSDRVFHLDPAGSAAHSIVVADLRITNGNAGSDGGGIANPVGAAAGADFVQLAQIAIDENRSSQGGGGAFLGGISWLVATRVDLNVATLDGGGVLLRPPAPSAAVRTRIERSTVSRNQSLRIGAGGGGGIASSLDTAIDASTVSGNTANANGGGVLSSAGLLAFADATVVLNRARANGAPNAESGGVVHLDAGPLAVANSVLAGNRAGSGAGTARDCSLLGSITFISSANSMVQAPGDCGFTGTNDIVGVDPQLLALGDNGGPTLTHLPGPASPVIDTGGACLADDQRGTKRPRDGDGDAQLECDRGAVEAIGDVLLRNGFE